MYDFGCRGESAEFDLPGDVEVLRVLGLRGLSVHTTILECYEFPNKTYWRCDCVKRAHSVSGLWLV